MPNPGSTTSLRAFDRETINMVAQIPDYKLRRQLSVHQKEAVIVEAFCAFDELYHVHLRWPNGKNYPEILLSSISARYQKVVLDLSVQSPHFTYSVAGSDGNHVAGAPVLAPCTWSTPTTPIEAHQSRAIVLCMDWPPTYNNDLNLSLEQTVAFTLVGTIWKLDEVAVSSLQCKSYRCKGRESSAGPPTDCTSLLISNLALMKTAADVAPDIQISLADSEVRTTQGAHAFVLQAQSPVFRRMLAGSMIEATDRVIEMMDVSAVELDDFLSALYGLGVPAAVREDESRLLNLLALADRYGVEALRDECASLLELRLSEGNMCALLGAADLHQAAGLRAAALQFVTHRAERMVAVMDTDNGAVRKSVREHMLAAAAAAAETRNDVGGFDVVFDGEEITV